jgi:ketosteroid isomerase-like protein
VHANGLLVSACLAPVYGQATKSPASGTTEAIKQLERDWAAAQKAVDVNKLSQIIADDWSGELRLLVHLGKEVSGEVG